LGPPSVGDHVPVDHLGEQAGPTASRVFLVSCGAVAGTHDTTAVGVATLAHADTTTHRLAETALVLRISQYGHAVDRIRRPTLPQVRIHRTRMDDDPGVHHVVGIEDALEPFEQRHGLGAVHSRQQLGTGLSVTVFT